MQQRLTRFRPCSISLALLKVSDMQGYWPTNQFWGPNQSRLPYVPGTAYGQPAYYTNRPPLLEDRYHPYWQSHGSLFVPRVPFFHPSLDPMAAKRHFAEDDGQSKRSRPQSPLNASQNDQGGAADNSVDPTEFRDKWRRWIPERNFRHTANSIEFTVMSYNILSPEIVKTTQYLYGHCETKSLCWSDRASLIIKQLLESNAQVICLQEVEGSFFREQLVPELGKKGYKGLYKKRTGSHPDGCAIFYSSEVFDLETWSAIEFKKAGDALLDRDNIAQIAVLRVRSCPERKLCVANTHILYNPKRGDVKLAQMVLLLTEIDKIAFRRFSSESDKPIYNPIILCGDMNFTPMTPLHKFVSTGNLAYNGLAQNAMSGQEIPRNPRPKVLAKDLIPRNLQITDNCQYLNEFQARLASNPAYATKGRFGSGYLNHDLNLVPVYKECGHDLISTSNLAPGLIVDYIFYSVAEMYVRNGNFAGCRENTLRLIARYSLLTNRQVSMLGGLPNSLVPSDHIPLMAKFLLKLK